ncbi:MULTISPECIES: ABC transporter permease [unclassified Methanoregula]|uniref:ABC transporter permease n=1 Tax=unclassified Methanoregula TaxID=2649730 RepID=UPI0009CE1106|nr:MULTISPECIES: FtsX-like permease family protein [unclassified Methanoregula]OPX65368.1 MAG: macrolide transporter ATP-binding /permease protein [Methanoregula sp. PtaB.Bin085]OPY32277.1 MAG: macrolide transporter ATP-binding /permease protein [Methanoregula sp. PtaU1.Bin006]
MLEEEQVALFLASRLIARGNKGTLALTIMIIAMVFVNLIFLPSIIAGVVVLFNQQTIDYSYANLVIEPKEGALLIAKPGTLVEKINRIPGVAASTPRYAAGATIVYKGKSTTPLVIAVDPDREPEVMKVHTGIISGDYLSGSDTGQILIGTTLAGDREQKVERTPTLGGVDVGKTVEVTFRNGVTKEFRVKGILKTGTSLIDNNAYISRRDLAGVLGVEDPANQILVRTQETGNENAMRLLLMQYGVQEQIWTWQDKSADFLKSIVGSFDIINLISTVVSLVIAVVVIFIVIFISIVYRRKQIGILQAIGIDRRIIIKSYIFQAIFICACGTVAGCTLLLAVLQYLAVNPLVFPGGPVAPLLEAGLVIRSIASLFIVALIAGFVPSWLTTREEILAAIRG